MTEPSMSKLEQKLAARRAAKEAEEKAREVPSEFADLVPTDTESYERSEADIEIDRLLARIGIIEAYNRWIGKSVPKGRAGQTESIMISCPMPNHPDRNPSAWLNSQKNTWFCAACDRGGDVLDLAAIKFGYDLDSYKQGSTFGQLRETVAEDYGFTRVNAPGLPRGGALVAPESEESTGAAEPASHATPAVPVPTPAPLATVTTLYEDETDDDLPEELPGLSWRELVEPGTFLDAYMAACTLDDVPEEYHFWNALLGLGLALGRDVVLRDGNGNVHSNLFICTLGRTGAGKSRSISYLGEVIRNALPGDPSDPNDRGAKSLPTAGSAEVLIKLFSKPIHDPVPPGGKPGPPIGWAPVRGLVRYSELSGIMSRAGRQGSTLLDTLQDLYDAGPEISNASLSNGEFKAQRPFGCLITSSQPKTLRTLLTQADVSKGFVNRIIFVTGTRKRRMSVGAEPPDLMEATERLRNIWLWADPAPLPGPQMVEWSPEALARWDEFYHDTLIPLQDKDPDSDAADLYQRLDLTMKKLMLLFTANERKMQVPVSAVERAISIFHYMVKVLEIPMSVIGNTVESDCERAIINLLERKGPLPANYISRRMSEKRKDFTMKLVERCIATMTNLGVINMEIPAKAKPGPGRTPVARFSVASSD